MEVPKVTITFAEYQFELSEDNCWVCIFHEAPQYDHLYIFEPDCKVVFECRELLDQLLQLGYPMQVRRLPRPWDENAFNCYIANQLEHIEEELDHLEGGE